MSNNPSTIPRGNTAQLWTSALTISPASVAANTTAEQTFTFRGLKLGDCITVNKPTAQAGLGIVGARATAADTLGITFVNATGSPIVPTAAETYIIQTSRADNVVSPGVPLRQEA